MAKGLSFREEHTITLKDYFDLVDYLDKNLVVGAELERAVPTRTDSLAVAFKAQRSGSISNREYVYKKACSNEYNIAFVTTDGTVDHGNEIIFGGTAEDFKWIHHKLKKIEDKLTRMRTQEYNSSCSTHISLVTLQDRIMSPTILKNIYNLTRAFSSSLYWIGSGDPRTILRPQCRNNANPHFSRSPMGITISSLQASTGKYSQCNIDKSQTITVGDDDFMSGLYVEFRSPDGIRAPSAVTALMFLYKALIYKAVELSMKGIVHCESVTDWSKNKDLAMKILSTDRMGRNSVTAQDKRAFIKSTNQMIDFLSMHLKRLSPESIPILRELANEPVGLRNRNKTIKQIESALAKHIPKDLTETEIKLIRIVIDDDNKAKSFKEWKNKVKKKLGCSERMIEHLIKNIESKTGQRIKFDVDDKRVIIL